MKKGIPSVFEYTDFREYLRSVYAAKRDTGFTLSNFSKFLGFRSLNYAGLVLSRKRSLTTANIIGAAKALRLTFNETEYLEAMVQHNQATSTEEVRYFERRLKALRKDQPKSSIRLSSTKVLSEWYFPAIVALVDRTRMNEAVTKITAALPIDEKRAAEILSLLIKEGLILADGEKYTLNSSHQIFYDEKSMSLNHKKYLLSQIDLSKKVFLRSYERGSKFYSHTFSIEKEDLLYYQNKIRHLLAECTARSDDTRPDGAAQLNIQLFPIELSNF
jgi:uncharacterized protein (TIGR02147 family)